MNSKRLAQVLMACLYMGIWSFMVGFDIKLLFSFRDFILVVIGSIFLTLPICKEERDKHKLWMAFKKQLTISGYLASFVLIFAEMTNPGEVGHITSMIAMCLRPGLYGFVCHLILGVEEVQEKPKEKPNDFDLLRQLGLTTREAEIAIMINKRMSNREIAEELYISETTVKKHVSHIFEKLEIDSRNEIEDVIEHAEK